MPNYLHPTKIDFRIEETDGDDIDKLITEATVTATWGASAELVDLLDSLEFSRRGRTSWSIGLTKSREISRFLANYARNFLPHTLISKTTLSKDPEGGYTLPLEYPVQSGGINPQHSQIHLASSALNYRLRQMPQVTIPSEPIKEEFRSLVAQAYANGWWRPSTAKRVTDLSSIYSLGVVELAIQQNTFWVRLVPANFVSKFQNLVQQPLAGAGARYSTPGNFQPHAASALFDKFTESHQPNVFQGDFVRLRELIAYSDTKVIAGYAPNQPAKVLLHVGRQVKPVGRSKLSKYTKGNNRTHIVTVSEALSLRAKGRDNFVIHESLHDIVNMDNAKPYMGDARLKGYQKEAVGLHLATSIGYLQTCSPGMGKTVIQLVAMRERSKSIPNYRGLVVSEANVRIQWKEEAAKWFPEAEVFVLQKGDDIDSLVTALSETKPVIVVMSYSHTLLAYEAQEAKQAEQEHINSLLFREKLAYFTKREVRPLTVGDLLLDSTWDDISADEAMIIRNGSSKQSQIMWTLRRNSKVATALTATPINKSPDDIGRLLAWVRNDKNLFTGSPLSEQYKTTTAEGGQALFNVFGPLVFRRDISEIADEMPETHPVVTLIDANPDEKALISAAENELKRCYLELTAALEEVEATGTANKDDLAKAKEQLRAANGAWLGGKQLARMAASDPAALLESESVGAALLKGQGLIDNALAVEPTKRKIFVQRVLDHVNQGKQIVVFTDFKTVAKVLAEVLEENGIRAKTYLGSNGTTRDRARVAFQNGDIDVLICSQAGERGLTLHRASVIINFDLPWVLERIIQRAGRGIRLGSQNATVEVEYLVVKDTLEQAIAEHLVELAASSLFVLDHSRGVDVKKTETAQAVSGLVAAFGNKASRQDLASLKDLLLKK